MSVSKPVCWILYLFVIGYNRFAVEASNFGLERCLNGNEMPCIRSRLSISGIDGTAADTIKMNLARQWVERAKQRIASQMLNFTLKLEKHLYLIDIPANVSTTRNIVFSPVNIATVMAVTLAGSAGRTFDEMSRVFDIQKAAGIPSDYSEIAHQLFGEMLEELNKSYGSTIVETMSILLFQRNYRIRPEYRQLTKYAYDGAFYPVDFVRNGHSVMQMVNNLVQERTHGLITNVLNRSPDSWTKSMIFSVLYFNGEWKDHFHEDAVVNEKFYIDENKIVETQLMYRRGDYYMMQDTNIGASMLKLPYVGDQMSMYILMPDKIGFNALRTFKNRLTVDTVESMINRLSYTDCYIALPKMNLTSEYSLNRVLSSMGIRSLFSRTDADLSLMTISHHDDDDDDDDDDDHVKRTEPAYVVEFFNYLQQNRFKSFGLDRLRSSDGKVMKSNLYVSDILHKTRIDINERGTSAAAFSSGIMYHSLATNFIANRPFMFMIRHDPSGLILFWATVNSPIA